MIQSPPDPVMAIATTPQRRVLVVDDEPRICAIVREALRADVDVIDVATQPAAALDRLRTTPFDLLITDIKLPGMDGVTLAHQARALQPLLSIVMVTGYGSVDTMTRALHTGIDDFLSKPFDLKALRLTVLRSLERQQLRKDNVRLQTLVRVFSYSQAITSTLDPAMIVRLVEETTQRETGAAWAHVWPCDDAGALRSPVDLPLPAALVDQTRGVVQAALEHARFQTAPIELPNATATLFAQPLVVSAERLGVLVACYTEPQQAALSELIGIIGNQAALALRNARQHHALHELNNLKSEFIDLASHELRTPLSVVLGYSALLRGRVQGREQAMLQQVVDGALRIGDILDDLMRLQRSDAARMDLQRAPADLWEVVRAVGAELQALAQARQVQIAVDCPSQALVIPIDREKLLLALAHLIDNATKWSAQHGTITLRGRVVKREALIEVHDMGIGIAPHDLGRVFDRFYQVEPSITRTHGGLGVGLTLTKMIVELHGGHIGVRSNPGQGSVFAIHLPLSSSHADVL